MSDINIRPEVMWFAQEMEKRLQENDYKGGWQECNISWLLMRAVEEMGELMNAWLSCEDYAGVEHSICECLDVGAFMMMAANNMKQRFLGDDKTVSNERGRKCE